MRKLTAFSLVELLVVVTIVSLLAGLILPVLASAKRRAKQTVCLANENQIGKATILYAGDYDDLFPYAVDATDKYASDIWVTHPDWQAQIPNMPLLSDALLPYTGTPDVFHCPADNGFEVLDNNFPTALSAEPSSFKAFGLSYVYRTELAFRHLGQTDLQSPTALNLLADASGHWHGGASALDVSDDFDAADSKLRRYRYNTVFGDLHAKSITRADMDRAWGQAP